MPVRRARVRVRAFIALAVVGASVALGSSSAQAERRADVRAPQVQITRPAAGASVSSPVRLSGLATDNRGVTKVSLQLQRMDTDQWFTGSGWQKRRVSFGARLADPGTSRTVWSARLTIPSGVTYRLAAIATDRAGNTSTRAVRSFSVPTPKTPDLQASLGSFPGFFSGTSSFVEASVTNIGNAATSGVTLVSVWAGSGVAVLSVDASTGWTCAPVDNGIDCTTGSAIAAGATIEFPSFIQTDGSEGEWTSIAIQVSNSLDTQYSNDIDRIDDTIAVGMWRPQ
jgi:hypothetical protein